MSRHSVFSALSHLPEQLHQRFQRLSPLQQGALLLMLGEAFLAIMGGLIKHLSASLSTEQIVFFRNLAGLLILMALMLRPGQGDLRAALHSRLYTRVWHWHLLRGLVGVSAMYCYFWALGNMPLAEAFLVKLSSPLFMPILAWLWLKESVTKASLLALIIGFAGVALILNPGGDSQFTFVALIGLMGAALAALAKVIIRRMSASYSHGEQAAEPSSRIVFYFALIATTASAPLAVINWQPVAAQLWWWLLLLGGVATLGQLALTRAYKTAPTGQVGVYAYSAVIYGALMGWLIWAEIPGWTTWLGAGLIIASGVINLRVKR